MAQATDNAPRRDAGLYRMCGYRRAGATSHDGAADERRHIAALPRSAGHPIAVPGMRTIPLRPFTAMRR
ncbi:MULTISPECIES: hypothetical protein [unclassified Streptomyces]|uniref:hypothetical protein n=1 Tax=unclassified Streptomyces TaxID=2593676 RepID=UPI001BB01737|nr:MULTISPECIES: hypothetical protein [unclassified Streptomyces]MDH6449445.1 hypothetical protein [Streptomyces sp. SAI-119]MDH6499973.1 hypothetical protein [Streptomyces sp. SAI-149]QUC61470.1 hypothetical protein IOD14_34390 [Streptomyces sp. A2-16]